MSNGFRNRLETQRSVLAESVAREILESPTNDVAADLKRLRDIDAVLAALPKRRRIVSRAPIAVALASILLLAAAWTAPISAFGVRTPIVLTATTSSLELALAADWTWNGPVQLEPRRFWLESASVRFSDPRLMPEGVGPDDQLTVEADQLWLRSLNGSAGARIAFEVIPEVEAGLFLRGGDVAGTASLSGYGTVAGSGRSRDFEVDVPETVFFGVSGADPLRAAIAFNPAQPFELREIEVATITFGRLASVEAGFVSGLQSGLLRLPEVAESHVLLHGQAVRLESLAGRIQRLHIGSDGIELALQGTASRVAIVDHDYVTDRTPSLLTYLYSNQRIAFLFGAVSFLWATLWSARRLFFP